MIRFLYTILLFLVSPILLFGLYKRKPGKPSFGPRWKEHFGITPKLKSQTSPIWIHAVSVGEVFEPELVLMDEPLGALDKQLREHMQYEIKHIHESLGVTVVYVTHDQSEALTMSNRIAVFNDGIVQQLADPVTLYERPDNAFVAQFIGENNTLVGTVDAISGKKVTVDLGKHGKVQATRVVNVAKGDKTTLSIRPERIAFSDKTVRGKVSLPAKVMELIYLGDHIRCRMQVAGNDEFIAKIPNSNKPISLSPGNKGYVSWNIDDCRALDYS